MNISTADVNKHIDKCVCPECGLEDQLGIDDVSCDDKKCKKCGVAMMTSLSQQNEDLLQKIKGEDDIEAKFRVLVEETGSDEKEETDDTSAEERDEKKKKKKAKDKEDPKEKKDDDEEEANEGRLFNRLDENDELNKPIDYKSKYHCEKCGIVINASIYEEENVCPKCGDDFAILEDSSFLDSERRFHCPKCSSSFKYTRINEDSCAFCNTIMTVFDKPEIKKSKTPLPFD